MNKKIKCWKFFKCNETKCPAYKTKELKCWLTPGTHCRNEIQDDFLKKIEMCVECKVFKANINVGSMEETLMVVNKQFKEFRAIMDERDRELEGISMELALGLSEVFDALKKIASGDPSVRISEDSELELISKLKHMVNLCAEELAEIVDLSHEFAIGLAEHFDVLNRVSKGDLDARISGDSKLELLESLKRLTNQMINSVSREIIEHMRTEEALRESEDRYRTLAKHVADGVSLIQDGKLVFVNDAFASMYGYTDSNQLVGKKAVDLLCRESKQHFSQIYEGLISGSSSEKIFQGKCISRNGREFWVEELYNMIQWNGQPAILATVRDVTEAKAREMAIKEDAERLKEANIKLRSTLGDRYRFGDLIGKSRPMQTIYNLIIEASASDAGVVIYGESGTGKELIAETIHNLSNRRKMAFVPVNCGAIPESIFESEFFGRRKGAYTDAYNDKPGFFDLAHRGTLFLDEVSELSPNMQVKLLRAIEGGGYTPVGDNKVKYSDVRIIATTNEILINLVKKGKMREDFFYRIHIIPIYVPPLKDRKEDIPLLVDHFLRLLSNGKNVPEIPSKIMEILYNYDWPGNVRELQNVLQRYITMKNLDLMDSFLIQENETSKSYFELIKQTDASSKGYCEEGFNLRSAVKNYEKSLIRKALNQANWNRKKVSKMLGIPLRTLSRKIKELEQPF